MKLTRRLYLIAAALASALGATNAAAQASSSMADSWRFSVTPYMWLPKVKATLRYNVPPAFGGGNATANFETDPDDYLSKLDMTLMLSGEARKGAWAIFTDFIFLDFSSDTAAVRTVSGPGGLAQVPVNTSTQGNLEGGAWQLAASYTVSRSSTATVEVLGGFRYLTLEATTDWQLAGPLGMFPQAGRVSRKEELWDAIVGVRGKARLGDGNWFVPWYLDAGGGDAKLTWQALAGIGYSFKWGDALLAYRHLYYEQKDDKLFQDLELSGPALGVAFRF